MATEDVRIDELPNLPILDSGTLMVMQGVNGTGKVLVQQLENYILEGHNIDNAVMYVKQALTDAQKAQARANIGAGSDETSVSVAGVASSSKYQIKITVNGVEGKGPAMSLVRYDTVQTGLTETEKAQARANIGAAAAGEGGGTVTDAVTYSPQTLTNAQKLQARANIAAQETLTVENLKDQIVINYPDKITKQFTSFVKYGRICIFTVQLIVNTAVSDNYGFIVATLPEATVDRIWNNNGTQFFIEVGSNGIRRNGEGLAAGNYMLSGFYLAIE